MNERSEAPSLQGRAGGEVDLHQSTYIFLTLPW